MGLSIRTGASYFRMTVPPNTLYGCHQFAEYTNTTGSAKVLESVTLYLGSGKGTFTSGATVTGAGGAFGLTVYVGSSVGKTSTQATVTITNNVTNTSNPRPSAVAYTFNFSNPVTVNANSTVQLWWWCEDTTGNKCLILDYSRGSVQESSPNYTVTFNLNGGTRTGGGELVQSIEPGGNAIAPTCSRTGYTFNGWNGSYTNVTSDRTIIATWERIKYTITYNKNGGHGSFTSKQEKLYDIDVNISSDQLYKPASVIYQTGRDGSHATVDPTIKYLKLYNIRWNTKPDGTGTSYEFGSTYTNNASVTLYAIYEKSVRIGEFPKIIQVDDGYIFRRWCTDFECTTEATEDLSISSNTYIYAEFMYRMTFDSGEGIFTNIETGESFKTYDKLIKYDKQDFQIPYMLKDLNIVVSYLPSEEGEDPSKEYVGFEAPNTYYAEGGHYIYNKPRTFTARFSLKTFTVIFTDGYSGAILKTVKNVKYGSSVYKPGIDPTRKGYKFLGWLGDYSYVTSDRTIVALWGITPVWIMTNDGWVKYEPKEE